ncbi:MAG: glycerol kinase GlpK [Candidatus Omnitrophica bacterium]|nr:glycerol kinase GlpK [Candidatus Omnitrophota bacterium]
MGSHILAIDQGTTGTRAILFHRSGRVAGQAYQELSQHFPKPGWVEHDPEEIWRSTVRVIGQAARHAGIKLSSVEAIGITNQRETTVLWDKRSGRPLYRAIVWQDRRTSDICRGLKPREPDVRTVTGLVLDPYFSGTKLTWLIRHVPVVSRAIRAGRAAFGTVDSWLLWKLTGGAVHATDVTNASRTLLYDLRRWRWSRPMMKMLGVPGSILPDVLPSGSHFGETARLAFLPSGIPIRGIAGDQQAALYGQGCVSAGSAKNTYGTGCFLLMQTGRRFVRSSAGLITTAACDDLGHPAYALEGSVFIAGAAVQWLRDGLKIIKTASETEKLARSVKDTGGVYFVPAFVGLGAPYWNPEARGLICGLTRGSGRAHLARAALESIAFQSQEVLEAMRRDSGIGLRSLQVDGGATKNDFLLQFQADLTGVSVVRPKIVETTALGAAQLAGVGIGMWSQKDLQRMRGTDKRFFPRWTDKERTMAMKRWRAAVARTLLIP